MDAWGMYVAIAAAGFAVNAAVLYVIIRLAVTHAIKAGKE